MVRRSLLRPPSSVVMTLTTPAIVTTSPGTHVSTSVLASSTSTERGMRPESLESSSASSCSRIFCQSTLLVPGELRCSSNVRLLQPAPGHDVGTEYFPSGNWTTCEAPQCAHRKSPCTTSGLTLPARTTVPLTAINLPAKPRGAN